MDCLIGVIGGDTVSMFIVRFVFGGVEIHI